MNSTDETSNRSTSSRPPSEAKTREIMLPRARTQVAFISGPLEASAEYFATYYVPPIERGIRLGHNFVLGAARGIDSMALEYLLSSRPPRYPGNKVSLYLSRTEASHLRPKYSWFEKIGGTIIIAGHGHTQRDEAMTRASHYDILRYRTDAECRELYGAKYRVRVSGTEKNEIRRKTGVGLVWQEVEIASEATGEVIGVDLVASTTTTTAPISAEDKKRRNLERKVKEAARLKDCLARGDVLEANQVAKAEKHDIWLKELQELQGPSLQ